MKSLYFRMFDMLVSKSNESIVHGRYKTRVSVLQRHLAEGDGKLGFKTCVLVFLIVLPLLLKVC